MTDTIPDLSPRPAVSVTARIESLDYMIEVLGTTLARLKTALIAGPFPAIHTAAILARIAETELLMSRTGAELAAIRARREDDVRIGRT